MVKRIDNVNNGYISFFILLSLFIIQIYPSSSLQTKNPANGRGFYV